MTVFFQVLAFEADDLLLEFAVVSLDLLQCLFESLKAPLVAKLKGALLLLAIVELAFEDLHATLEPVQVALVGALSLFQSEFQVGVFLLEKIGGSHDAQVVGETLRQIFSQFQVQHHNLLDADFFVGQID